MFAASTSQRDTAALVWFHMPGKPRHSSEVLFQQL